jgi:hypothetical protein
LEEWEATVRSIADGLGVVWPNEPEKVAREAGAPLQERIERRLAAAEAALNRLKELLGNFRAASSETNPRFEPLNDELQGSAAQISHYQDDLIKLQAELSERVNEGERLRQQIDSIHASICWRITSPIRWFYKQVNGWPGSSSAMRR